MEDIVQVIMAQMGVNVLGNDGIDGIQCAGNHGTGGRQGAR